jgi:formyl-CoA transferase
VHRRGQDLAAQAISGLMALTGSQETGPVPVGTFMIDYLASMQFAQGMMIALAAREKTGRGQVVDSNLLNAAITSHLQEGTTYLNTGQRFDRPGAGIAHAHNTALYGYYQAADGLWCTLIGEFYVDRPWQRAARACGLAQELVDDPRFQTIEGLREHTEETHRLLAGAIAKFPRAEIMARFEAEDVLVAPVHDYDAVFDDPQVRHNGLVLESEVDGVGPVKWVGMPVALSETPARLRHVPPTIGRHNDEVLAAAGLGPERIAELKAAGVVGSERDRERAGGPAAWS